MTADHLHDEQYRPLFEANPAPMLIYERGSLRVLRANEAFARHYGYDHEALLRLRLSDLYAESDRPALLRFLDALGEAPAHQEWRHLRRDGSVIDVVIQSHDILHQGRHCRLGVVTDITHIKRTQLRERQRMEVLDGLVRSTPLQPLLDQLSADHEALFPGSACTVRLDADPPACEGWTLPIRGPQGEVLGTFIVQRSPATQPGDEEQEHATFSAQLAATAIAHWRTRQALQDRERQLSLLVQAMQADQQRISRLNRAYAVLSGMAEALMQQPGRDVLFTQACQLTIDEGGFCGAWIGMPFPDDPRGPCIRPVVFAGSLPPAVLELRLPIDADNATAQAMRERRPFVANDIQNHPRLAAWTSCCRELGYRSGAAFPIAQGGQAIACLWVYSSVPEHFDHEQVALFERMTQNLGLALDLRAAQEAHERERQFKEQLVESVAGIFYVLDSQGRLLQWNRRLVDILQRDEADLPGLPALDCFAPDDRDHIARQIAWVFAHGEIQTEGRLQRKDGREAPHLFTARRLGHGADALIVGTGIDITDRLRIEHELLQHRQHLEALVARRTQELEAMNARLHCEDQRLRAMLALSQRASGLSEGEIFRLGMDELVQLTRCRLGSVHTVEEDGRLVVRAWAHDQPCRLDAGDPPPEPASAGAPRRALWEAVRADGAPRQGPSGHAGGTCSAGVPVFDKDRLCMILCIVKPPRSCTPFDLRELQNFANDLWRIVRRRRMEMALEQAKAAADAANQAKSAFLANMSHEIRTPMNAVLGFARLLRDEPLPPRQSEFVGHITDAGEHLMRVINDILDFSKIEVEKIRLEESDLDLHACAERTMALLRDGAAHKGLALTADIAPACPRWIRADRLRLEQILINLLSNAVKFTERGRVHLSVILEPPEAGRPQAVSRLRLAVSDTGIGVRADLQHHLFEAFEQADVSTTRRFGGTGLGLSISRRLARLMGGDITVDSEEGRGSTFTLTLPCLPAQGAGRPAEPAAPALAPPSRGARILIAEDHPINQEVARRQIERLGLRVDVVGDGARAVDRIREGLRQHRPYDLVLMDMQMPVMDGLQATGAIRTLPGTATLPIVAMTANAFDQDRDLCLAAGMNDHLPKPVDPQRLRECLARWVGAPSAMTAPGPIAPAPTPPDLPELPGFDLNAAWMRLGQDPQGLRHALRLFLEHHADDRERLQLFAARPTAETLVERRRFAHALTGAAGTLGAVALQRCALTLERLPGDADVATTLAAIADLDAELERGLDALSRVLRTPPPAPPPSGTTSAPNGGPGDTTADPDLALRELRLLVAAHDTEALDRLTGLRPHLEARHGEAAHRLLERDLHGFDFESALSRLDDLLAAPPRARTPSPHP